MGASFQNDKVECRWGFGSPCRAVTPGFSAVGAVNWLWAMQKFNFVAAARFQYLQHLMPRITPAAQPPICYNFETPACCWIPSVGINQAVSTSLRISPNSPLFSVQYPLSFVLIYHLFRFSRQFDTGRFIATCFFLDMRLSCPTIALGLLLLASTALSQNVTTAPAGQVLTHVIQVSGKDGGLKFYPAEISGVNPGDLVQFHFYPKVTLFPTPSRTLSNAPPSPIP